jgi:[ribosomal protein S18]-alanine N-acetyltransferase
LRIRRLEARDIDAVLAIQAASPEIAEWSARDYQEVAGGEMAGWVAEEEGVVAGFLVARELVGETEILNLAVRSGQRRQRIGTGLIEAATAWSRGLGAEGVMLEVRESNAAAIRFYERHGFVEVGRRVKYYMAPVEDAVVMSLKVS